MNAVKINRQKLLNIVQENMIKHVAEYNEAVADHLALSIKVSKENIALAKATLKLIEDGKMDKVTSFKSLPQKPTSYEDNYKRAIRMLELSVEDVIEVEEDVFNQLVLDEWVWKRAFTVANTMYKSAL